MCFVNFFFFFLHFSPKIHKNTLLIFLDVVTTCVMCVTHIDVKCVPYDAIPLALWLDSEREAVSDIITRRDNPFLNPGPQHEDGEHEEEQGDAESAIPNKQKDDLAQRRAHSRPLPQKDGPTAFVSAHMTQTDMQKWERLKMTEPRCPSHVLWFHIHTAQMAQMLLLARCVIYQWMSVCIPVCW